MWAKIKTTLWEIVKFVVIVLIVVIPIRTYIAQPFIVSGASMDPTFHNNEYLIIDELSYRFHEPARGEVIVFRYPKVPKTHFIKRIIGLPNETIRIAGNVVTILTKNGSTETEIVLTEDYVKVPFQANYVKTLGADEYFVMGDNRPVSLDSRAWGPLPRKFITGRVLFRLFPFQNIAYLPGHD